MPWHDAGNCVPSVIKMCHDFDKFVTIEDYPCTLQSQFYRFE